MRDAVLYIWMLVTSVQINYFGQKIDEKIILIFKI